MLFLDLTAYNSKSLSVNNTGLGNVLFQLSCQYGICKKFKIKENYHYLEKFVKKLEKIELRNYRKTIFRNIINNNFLNNMDHNIDIILNENKGAHVYDHNLILNIIKNKNKNILVNGSYLQSLIYFNEFITNIQELFSPDVDSLNTIYQKYPLLKISENINISIILSSYNLYFQPLFLFLI